MALSLRQTCVASISANIAYYKPNKSLETIVLNVISFLIYQYYDYDHIYALKCVHLGITYIDVLIGMFESVVCSLRNENMWPAPENIQLQAFGPLLAFYVRNYRA